MTEVWIHQLTKVFLDGTRAVDLLDLRIRHGELLVLVGPSGCGKTTTLRMLAGLESPSSGEISFDGQSVRGLAPRQRDVAMVFQNYALYPHMTVAANLSFPLRMRGATGSVAKKRAHDLAEKLGISRLLSKKPHALSGGQQQRVALGRALIRNPGMLLLDEPLSNLDATTRTKLRTEIKRLHRDLGTTVVYVTHDQSEAMVLGDRIAVMNRGRLEQLETPLRLYRKPNNRFVGSFIGSPPMQFYEVQRLDARRVDLNGIELHGLSCPTDHALLGLRPHDIIIGPDYSESVPCPSFLAEVELVEVYGHENLITARVRGVSFCGVAPAGFIPSARSRVRIRIEDSASCFFDVASGEALVSSS